jgi:hypothetical protein
MSLSAMFSPSLLGNSKVKLIGPTGMYTPSGPLTPN